MPRMQALGQLLLVVLQSEASVPSDQRGRLDPPVQLGPRALQDLQDPQDLQAQLGPLGLQGPKVPLGPQAQQVLPVPQAKAIPGEALGALGPLMPSMIRSAAPGRAMSVSRRAPALIQRPTRLIGR